MMILPVPPEQPHSLDMPGLFLGVLLLFVIAIGWPYLAKRGPR